MDNRSVTFFRLNLIRPLELAATFFDIFQPQSGLKGVIDRIL